MSDFIVVPLTVFLLGIITLARGSHIFVTMTQATRVGARKAVLPMGIPDGGSPGIGEAAEGEPCFG